MPHQRRKAHHDHEVHRGRTEGEYRQTATGGHAYCRRDPHGSGRREGSNRVAADENEASTGAKDEVVAFGIGPVTRNLPVNTTTLAYASEQNRSTGTVATLMAPVAT